MNDLINLELQNCIANAATAGIYNTLESIRQEYTCPSAVYRPKLSVDGDQYCVLYGEDLQSGVAGFGTSAAKAMSDFDRNWNTRLSALVPSTPMSKLSIAAPVNHLVGQISVGEYCLATKFSDGEAWDPYAVGFYAGEIFPGRHQVVDNDGKPFRANGFRRCEPITREQGNFILHASGISDTNFKLWDYIQSRRELDEKHIKAVIQSACKDLKN